MCKVGVRLRAVGSGFKLACDVAVARQNAEHSTHQEHTSQAGDGESILGLAA